VGEHAVDERTSKRGLAGGDAAPQAGPRAEIWFHRRVSLRSAIRELWKFRELVITLTERDLRARYKQAFLGFAWAVVTPLMLMAVFTLLFTKFKVAKIDAEGVPYALFAYLGLIPWTFFSASVGAGGMSLVANLSIVNKVYCPREVFPISSVLVAAIDTFISVFVLGILFAVTGFAPKAAGIYYAAPLLLVLLVFTLGVTFAASALLVYLRDLRHALPLILQLGLFATPVAYGMKVIAGSSQAQVIYSAVNPLAPVIDGFRRTILFGQQPAWGPLAAAAVTSILLLVVSYLLFKRLETGIADVA
jgi:ABC-2 type transport system permease protein/lipopolysaccharide transport system permease protein